MAGLSISASAHADNFLAWMNSRRLKRGQPCPRIFGTGNSRTGLSSLRLMRWRSESAAHFLHHFGV